MGQSKGQCTTPDGPVQLFSCRFSPDNHTGRPRNRCRQPISLKPPGPPPGRPGRSPAAPGARAAGPSPSGGGGRRVAPAPPPSPPPWSAAIIGIGIHPFGRFDGVEKLEIHDFEVDLAGLQLRDIENVVDQSEQRLGAVAYRDRAFALLRCQIGIHRARRPQEGASSSGGRNRPSCRPGPARLAPGSGRYRHGRGRRGRSGTRCWSRAGTWRTRGRRRLQPRPLLSRALRRRHLHLPDPLAGRGEEVRATDGQSRQRDHGAYTDKQPADDQRAGPHLRKAAAIRFVSHGDRPRGEPTGS